MKNFLIELVNVGTNLSPRSPRVRIFGVLLRRKSQYLIGCIALCLMTQELRGESFYKIEKELKVNKIKVYESPKLSTYILEGAGAAVGGMGITMGTYLMLEPFMVKSTTQEFMVMQAMMCGVISIGIGSTFGTVLGTTIVGKVLDEEGSFLKSLLGSTIGGIVGIGVLYVGYGAYDKFGKGEPPNWYQGMVIGGACLCPIAGSVIGYNF